ncbi:MAG: adhesin [Corynebacterium sp.]|nr:adhesin [Corynebacterium sp.]
MLVLHRATARRVPQLIIAATMVAAFTASSFGISPSHAAPVVGVSDTTAVAEGTNNLRITLTKGNADDGQVAEGKVVGVTIHLKRLAGIAPDVPSDMSKLKHAKFDEVMQWPTDHHVQAITDENATVNFAGLPTGIYIVSSTPAEGFREVNPFFVAVPFHSGKEGDSVAGVILAKPKNEKPPIPPVPSTPPRTPTVPVPPAPSTTTTPPPSVSEPPTPVPGHPGTKEKTPGLAMTGAQVIGVVIAAAILILLGAGLLLTSRRKSHEAS